MNIDMSHVEASIRRFYKSATVLAKSASGIQQGEMEFYPVIVGKSPNFMAFTSPGGETDPDFLTPYIVNASFCLEILIKSVIYYGSGEWVRGHDLIKLYEQVDPKVKRVVNESFKKACANNRHYRAIQKQAKSDIGYKLTWSMVGVLSASSKAFESWRYAFDNSQNNSCFMGFGEAYDVLNREKERLRVKFESTS
ncbi:TPA: hypothetical protein P0E14_005245 [Vibrio harveyi]|nr:hypothetical protein [Vibrio harveyi]